MFILGIIIGLVLGIGITYLITRLRTVKTSIVASSVVARRSIKTAHLRLEDDNIIVPALTEEFDPQKEFRRKGIWMSENFEEYVLNPTQPFTNIPEMSFSKHSLKTVTPDNDIISELEIKPNKLLTREQILLTIDNLTSKQPNGGGGQLLTNEYATLIGYFMCADGVVRVACVDWDAGYGGWRCDCYELGSWPGGFTVLACN